MKLRLRSLESKQTHKIEIPNSSNLHQLKQAIISQLSLSSSSSQQPCNLILSLNRREQLCGSSPEESLQSLGLTSGDLIFFSLNFDLLPDNVDLINTQKLDCVNLDELSGFSDQSQEFVDAQMKKSSNLSNPSDKNVELMDTQKLDCVNLDELSGFDDQSQEFVDAQMKKSSDLTNPSDKNQNLVDFDKVECNPNDQSHELVDAQMKESSNLSNPIEIPDEMEVDDGSMVDVETKFSVPSFLRKVFVKEVGDVANGGNHKLLVIAVHAVLMESGFVAYNPVSGMKVDGFHLPDVWPSSAFGISLHYTLPEISTCEVVDTVVVKFQTLGKFVNVYGTLVKKGFGVHRVCLDEPRFVSALNFVWKKSDCVGSMGGNDEFLKLGPFREIFEFWKIVKDGLSYPLLIELCEKTGLASPPCLMCLPTELKLMILESVPAIDIAKVACACSELRFVCSNNDLWRLKYDNEFGMAMSSQGECQWKEKFASSWEMRKNKRRRCIPHPLRQSRLFPPLFPGRRDPNPLFYPSVNVIGGDYDRLPALGLPHPQHHGWRLVRRNFDLGGLDA